MANNHPVPARRAAVYVRVSSEEQVQGYSLAAQERAAAAFCTQHGWEVAAIYRDEGRSARSDAADARPAFARMLQDAEAGRVDVVVVHKLDRFARNRRVAFEALDRLGKARVGFVSLSEQMDYSTSSGQLMLTMLVGLGQFYSDNLSAETKKGKGERKRQGMYNGLLPFGTTKGADGVPVLDTEARWCDVATRSEVVPAAGLALAFDLAAAGQTDREVARALNAAGHRTSGNRGANPFSKDSVRVVLRNRFYLGDLPDGEGGWVPGRHGALVDPALFDRAEAQRAANTRRPRRTAGTAQPWALSGLAVCGTCGRSFVANSRPGGRRSIRCSGRIQGTGCDEPSFYADVTDAQLAAIVGRFAVPAAEQDRLVTLWRRSQSRAVDTAAARIAIRRKLARLQEVYLDGDLDRAAYQERRAALMGELADLPPEGDPDGDAGRQLAAFLADLGAAWPVATPEERNRLARQLFSEAVIENRTVVAVKPRPDLLPFFEGVTWCMGGSDGSRFGTFRTFWLLGSGFRYPTSGARLRSPSARRAPMSLFPGIATALVN